MAIDIGEERIPKNMTSSGVVKGAPGKLAGILINSHSSGTLKLWDNATAASGTALGGTITLAVGERSISFLNTQFLNGLFITIGGTADITVMYR